MANNQQLLLGEGAGGGIPNYIEEVFSTYLYTGNGSTQTITNGIDLSTKGGLVWFKPRDTGNNHNLIDSVRGINKFLISNATNAQGTNGAGYGIASFNTTGFSLDPPWTSSTNTTSTNYVSWTFREQPKFFDIVTYTGTGSNTTIAHNLGAVPGCIIVKRTDTSADWAVYHRSLANTEYLVLNTTAAKATGATWWNSTTPTSSVFSIGTDASVNASGGTYVAYIYGHDAGGFGLAGTDNVISCGSYTYSGSALEVNLGFEPQFIFSKATDRTYTWDMYDVMRGMPAGAGSNTAQLVPNSAAAESVAPYPYHPTATGFIVDAGYYGNPSTVIYIAIRRGPMKVPTVGTSVFNAITRTGTAAAATVTGVGFPPDLMIVGNKTGVSGVTGHTADRLRGKFIALRTNATAAEISDSSLTTGFLMDGVSLGDDSYDYGLNKVMAYVDWFFRRAPSFFDEVCYTGTGVATTQAHNLAAVPEMMIVKRRNAANNWAVYAAPLGNTDRVFINQTGATLADSTLWNNTTPTSSVFTVGTAFATNNPADTYVAYLFATLAGVSKVGSYTGTGTTQVINCGFTSGARFVLIKKTSGTGSWYVWDSARGIIAGNDPYLLLNSATAEVTSTDYVDTASVGFEISSTAPSEINENGGSFIFLAIA